MTSEEGREPIEGGEGMILNDDGDVVPLQQQRQQQVVEQPPGGGAVDMATGGPSQSSQQEVRGGKDGMRELFGGAMRCLLPASFHDVSSLRQVPDHQEVFLNDQDISVIVEILDRIEGLTGADSAKYFWNDLAEVNEAISSDIRWSGSLVASAMPSFAQFEKSAAVGVQEVARSPTKSDTVTIYLVNVRLAEVGTDLLITMNVPNNVFGAGGRPPVAGVTNSVCFNNMGQRVHPCLTPEGELLPEAMLQDMIRTFEIVDWSLFA